MDRLTYAVIGAVFGSLLGVICWFLYGLGFSNQFRGMNLHAEALPWVKVFASLFGALGFILKDRAGTILGNSIAGLFSAESGRDHGPNLSLGAGFVVLAVVAGIVWYVVTS